MKKNRDFFYLQYNKINWKNQEQTKINAYINEQIINSVILKHQKDDISIFDIGFGIGFFIKMIAQSLVGKYQKVVIEGCEPSQVNFTALQNTQLSGVELQTHLTDFLNVKSDRLFDFITAIYVFPHFVSEDLEDVTKKISSMLAEGGKFVLVLANEKYLQEKLDNEKDLFLEKDEIVYNSKIYKEVLHYSDIPEIGKVIDYNREESLYIDMFTQNGFSLETKEEINDNGFICSMFVFKKM